jgi:hypothetical protein
MLLVAHATSSMAKELEGFGEAKLRMTTEAVKKALPALTPDGGVPPAEITYYQLANQRFLDLEPCTLRFNFFRDKLYEIQFDCGRDAKVVKALEREFGEPTMRESYGTFWYWSDAVLGLSQGSKVFGLSDRALSPTVQQAIMRAAAAEKATGAAGSGAATPGAAK